MSGFLQGTPTTSRRFPRQLPAHPLGRRLTNPASTPATRPNRGIAAEFRVNSDQQALGALGMGQIVIVEPRCRHGSARHKPHNAVQAPHAHCPPLGVLHRLQRPRRPLRSLQHALRDFGVGERRRLRLAPSLLNTNSGPCLPLEFKLSRSGSATGHMPLLSALRSPACPDALINQPEYPVHIILINSPARHHPQRFFDVVAAHSLRHPPNLPVNPFVNSAQKFTY